MPEPDCFLRYRMRYNAKFYYVGKIRRIGIGCPVVAARRIFKTVLFTASRGNTFVGGKCALSSALLCSFYRSVCEQDDSQTLTKYKRRGQGVTLEVIKF